MYIQIMHLPKKHCCRSWKLIPLHCAVEGVDCSRKKYNKILWPKQLMRVITKGVLVRSSKFFGPNALWCKRCETYVFLQICNDLFNSNNCYFFPWKLKKYPENQAKLFFVKVSSKSNLICKIIMIDH